MVVEEEEEARDLEAVLEAAQAGWKKPGCKKNILLAQKREFLGFFQFQEYFLVHPDFKL